MMDAGVGAPALVQPVSGARATVAGLRADAVGALIGGRFGVDYVGSPGAVSGPGAGAVHMAVRAAAQDRCGAFCPRPLFTGWGYGVRWLRNQSRASPAAVSR